ncbi:efflux transporter outer membrane subunit [Pelagicoccus sp. SDUM812002]|uniref:efflux transporter outer membrane subunit n=1 Tax=Pelagicoccus sp. SDUM812002 TaxID=3041266 RepID=UPI002810F676|nr:efflux transporter outer membrane subunit [Pelagicoccus sp. SDUM812002]
MLLVIALASACSSTRSEFESDLALPGSFSHNGSQIQGSDWWTAFADPVLNKRVEKALAANRSLEATWQSVEEARAIVTRSRANLYPNLDASVSATEVKPEDGPARESYQATLEAAYEVDIWGRVRSSARAEQARLTASYYDYQSAALSLAAEVATLHFQLVEQHLQGDLIASQVEANRKVLESLRNRFNSGLIRSSDILRQEQLVENSLEQAIVIEAQIAVYEHAMSILLGETPQQSSNTDRNSSAHLPAVPDLPATGVPSELVTKRPDVRAVFQVVAAANSELASAIADRFPTLSIGASISSVTTNWSDIFETWIRELAAEVLAPLFDGGNRRAIVKQSEATVRRLLAEYEQRVLVALQEVEDALVLETAQSKRITSKSRQVELAQNAYQQLQSEYTNGVSDYLNLVTALIDLQSLQRDLVEAQRIKIEYRIALYRALAGPVSTDLVNSLESAR